MLTQFGRWGLSLCVASLVLASCTDTSTPASTHSGRPTAHAVTFDSMANATCDDWLALTGTQKRALSGEWLDRKGSPLSGNTEEQTAIAKIVDRGCRRHSGKRLSSVWAYIQVDIHIKTSS